MRSFLRDVSSKVAIDFRRIGWELAKTDLVYKLVAFTILFPLVGLALRLFVSMSGSSVLADEDILLFVSSPFGMVTLVVVAAVALAIVALEQACLMTLGMGAVDGHRVGAAEAFRFAAARSGSILALAIRIVLRVLALAAPFLAAGGLVYRGLLSDFDINYYLAEKPPVFWVAAAIVSALLVAMGALLMPRLIGWSLALPLHLFEDVPAARALKTSAERTVGRRWSIAGVLVGWSVLTAVVSAAASGAVSVLSRTILPPLTDSLRVMVLALGGLLLLGVLASLVISLFAASAFALLVVRLYDPLAPPRETGLRWSEISVPTGVGGRRRFSKKNVAAGLAVAAVAAGLVGDALVESIRLDDDVLVIAHRGAAGAAPENTLASVERAIAAGADLVEIDVQETADGEVVVIHDSDLMKIAGVNLKIWDATYDRLQDIDVGSWFSPEFSGERVPKLEQVLELCKGRTRVNIELKYYGHDERLEERVVEIVERTGMESQVVVMSLRYDAILKMRRLRPQWTLGLLTARAVGDLTRLDADFLAVHTGLAKPRFVRNAHRRGKEVFVWTVNDPIQMSTMLSRGVDGLITDEPALARAVLRQRADMDPVERLLVSLSLYFGVEPRQPGPETDIDD